jgi:hypothetical protein
MFTDTTRTRGTANRAGTASGRQPLARPLEPAQLVWRLARTIGERRTLNDPFADALGLLRSARHRPAVMTHALTLGRTHLRAHPRDADARAGATILEAAIAYLGVKPRAGDVPPHRATR